MDGVLVPGGFGVRGIEGKIGAVRYAREHGIPLLGLCLGLQCMAIEVGRHLAGLDGANSAEFDPAAPHPGHRHDGRPGGRGRRRAGHGRHHAAGPATRRCWPRAAWSRELYGTDVVHERHRHRYEVNNAYRRRLEEAGLVCSGLSPDGRLVEFVELPRDVHPFFVATQAHPEFLSRPTRPHPLFSGLVAAALERSRALPAAEPVAAAGPRAAASA